MADERSSALPPELVMDEPPITEDELTDPMWPGETGERHLDTWEHVEWALRRLARSRAAVDVAAAHHAEMVGRIDAWYEREVAADKRAIDRLDGLLQRFAIAQRTIDPRTATFRFPSGTLRTTLRKDPRIDIADEQAVLKWCLVNLSPAEREAVIAQTLSVRVTELRNHLVIAQTPDGEAHVTTRDLQELVPGVVVNPPEITAKVELGSQEGIDQ